MTHPHPRALEAAARATYEARFKRLKPQVPWERLDASYSGEAEYNRNIARAAVTAYLAEAGDGRLAELERENAALLEFVRMVSAIPHPDKRPEDDIDALYMNERRLAGLIRAASGHLETEKSGEKQ